MPALLNGKESGRRRLTLTMLFDEACKIWHEAVRN